MLFWIRLLNVSYDQLIDEKWTGFQSLLFWIRLLNTTYRDAAAALAGEVSILVVLDSAPQP